MDKNSLIGLGLMAAILITWLALTGPSKEQIARNKQIKDSVELAIKAIEIAEAEKVVAHKTIALKDTSISNLVTDSIAKLASVGLYKDFAASANGKAEMVTLENENIKVYISTKGANISVFINENSSKNYK